MAGWLRKRYDALDHRMSARLRKLHQLGVIDADAVQRLRAAFAAGKTIRFEIDLAGRYGGERVGFRGQRGGENFHCCSRYALKKPIASQAGLRSAAREVQIPGSLDAEEEDRKSTRLNSSHYCASRMPSSA